MGDRFHDDFEIAPSSHSIRSDDDYYNEDEEEMEGEEVNNVEIAGKSEELACPFCPEDFDVLGLCCHIDADHRTEVKPGICPVCATKVGVNMASHVITQHESILKALCNKKQRGARPRSSILVLRKEMQEKHLHCIKEPPNAGAGAGAGAAAGGPSATSDSAADSMLLSFVKNSQRAGSTQSIEDGSLKTDAFFAPASSSTDDYLESKPPSLSTNGNNERARRCDFLQELLLSTILDDL